MTRLYMIISGWLTCHRFLTLLIFLVLTAGLLFPVLGVKYRENITDFLPQGDNLSTVMELYSDISGANNIYAVVRSAEGGDIDRLLDGVDELVESLDTVDCVSRVTARIDQDEYVGLMDSVYGIMPLLLTEADYDRIDSLLATDGYIADKLADDYRMLLTPTSGMISQYLSRDPLALFSPVMERLRNAAPNGGYTTVDGYILSDDSLSAFIKIETNLPPNETSRAARLISRLEEIGAEAGSRSGVEVLFTGSQVIGVENARCIKRDSLWSVAVAVSVVLVLLFYVFRSWRNILLIFVTVGWGWLFALSAVALGKDEMSIIVIGIASVMLGIAINYPLHMIDTLSESENRNRALKSIVAPLVVGNITTVGAFLCLVPIEAPALSDLGLFGSMLLIGTILFTLFFLPQLVKIRNRGNVASHRVLDVIAARVLGHNNKLFIVIVLLTLLLAFFIPSRLFDPDLRHINYLSDSQQRLFDDMQESIGRNVESGNLLYIVSSGVDEMEMLDNQESINSAVDSVLGRHVDGQFRLVAGSAGRGQRLARWKNVVERFAVLRPDYERAVADIGFGCGAFHHVNEVLEKNYDALGDCGYDVLYQTVLQGDVSRGKDRVSIVRRVVVDDDDVRRSLEELRLPGMLLFDMDTISNSMTVRLIDNFNYIATACGFIVFIFLWLSMGRIELAVISFLPMAISWVWIFGFMGITGMQFNIVNIILATFIFGQGDDYTIFITEGLCYEYAYGRPVVNKYKTGILVSALLMLAGIGVLAFATHPAMKSLGEITVVGMLSVLLMASVLPGGVFGFITRTGGRKRFRPVTLYKLLLTCSAYCLRILGVKRLPGIKIDVVGLECCPSSCRLVHAYGSWLERLIIDIAKARCGSVSGGLHEVYVGIIGLDMLIGKGERIYSPGKVTVVFSDRPIDMPVLSRKYLSVADVAAVVYDRYLYKGVEVARESRSRLKKIMAQPTETYLMDPGCRSYEINEPGNGELSLIMALLNPKTFFHVEVGSDDSYDLLVQNSEIAVNMAVNMPK